MEDFFKQFRDNLERRPDPEMEEKDWRDLQRLLDREGEKRPAVFVWLWLTLPLLMLSLGANAVFYRGLETLRRQIAALETRRDTVFQTRVVYLTDTIHQTRLVQKTVFESTRNILAPSFSRQELKHSQRSDFLPGASDTSNRIETGLLKLELKKTQNTRGVLLDTTNFERLNAHALPLLSHTQPPDLPEIPAQMHISKKRKNLRLHILRPKGFHLGFTGGWAQSLGKNLEHQGGFSVGLQTAVEFLPSLRMWGEAAFFNTPFETDRMDESMGVPPVDPPSDDYVFVKAEVPQPSWQYALGMQYLFNAKSKFKPFIGAGYGAVSFLPYEIAYEFKDNPLGVEWSFEKEIERRAFLTDFLLLRAGFESPLFKRWRLQIQATHRSHLGKADLRAPDLLGVQGGLTWEF